MQLECVPGFAVSDVAQPTNDSMLSLSALINKLSLIYNRQRASFSVPSMSSAQKVYLGVTVQGCTNCH